MYILSHDLLKFVIISYVTNRVRSITLKTVQGIFMISSEKIIVRYKRIGYNINIMRQSACLMFNPITVNNFASLFNCTPVGRASDSMKAPI